MTDLPAVVKKYLELAGGFDRPLDLTLLGLPRSDIERLFSAWDEDYQISRFMLLAGPLVASPASDAFLINGQTCTHVTFRQPIQQLLGD